MKTNQIGLKSSGLLQLIMAAIMTLTFLGCEEDISSSTERFPYLEREYNENVKIQTFKVQPEGTEVSVFGGSVLLNFPEGSVSAPTLFIITLFPIDPFDLDGINMYNKGLYLEGDTPNQKLINVTIQVNYDLDPESWKENVPDENAEQNLTIFHVSPDIYAYQRINSVGNCCIDSECKMIKGCIKNCGYYVVGEN